MGPPALNPGANQSTITSTLGFLVDMVLLHPVFKYHQQPDFHPAHRLIAADKSLPQFFYMITCNKISFRKPYYLLFAKITQFIFHPYFPWKQKALLFSMYNLRR